MIKKIITTALVAGVLCTGLQARFIGMAVENPRIKSPAIHRHFQDHGIHSLVGIERVARKYPRLQSLDVSWNRISTVENGTFRRLTGLKMLRLGRNKITTIQAGAFEGLSKLETLGLVFNRLTKLSKGTFRGMPNLKVLMLTHNQLTEIPVEVLEELPQLERLDIIGNPIAQDPQQIAKIQEALPKVLIITTSKFPLSHEWPVEYGGTVSPVN